MKHQSTEKSVSSAKHEQKPGQIQNHQASSYVPFAMLGNRKLPRSPRNIKLEQAYNTLREARYLLLREILRSPEGRVLLCAMYSGGYEGFRAFMKESYFGHVPVAKRSGDAAAWADEPCADEQGALDELKESHRQFLLWNRIGRSFVDWDTQSAGGEQESGEDRVMKAIDALRPIDSVLMGLGSGLPSDNVRNAVRRLDCARNGLVNRAKPMVDRYANKYKKIATLSYALKDLEQEGYFGLFYAADRFDPEKGMWFPSYVAQLIKQQIKEGLQKQNMLVRIGRPLSQDIAHIGEAVRRLRVRGLTPTAERVAGITGIDEHRVEEVRAAAFFGTVSLDQPMGTGNGDEEKKTSLGDVIPLMAEPGLGALDAKHDRIRLTSFLMQLPPRDEYIVRARFGIGLPDCMSLDELAQRYGVTKERIRQIEVTTVEKLRDMLEGREVTRPSWRRRRRASASPGPT